MKLHIGSGDKILKGFVNVDIRNLPGVDVVTDIHDLSLFEGDDIELIYCSHVLEHVPRFKYMDILQNWYSILKIGGKLRLAVPDIESVFKHYSKYKNLEILRGFLWGGQTYDENYHYCGWDFETLSRDLKSVGFDIISRYNWNSTEHKDVDDFSQCYLPHMDKVNGQLMSLNVEAIKL
jgi:ubiquinone/menaquinone biosynthesis C-methylase UbiE